MNIRIIFLAVVFWNILFLGTAQEIPRYQIVFQELIIKESLKTQKHASTLIELSNGDLLTAWFEGSYEGASDVCIWGSFYHNNSWSSPQLLVFGIVSDSLHLPCWNPVLFRNLDNTIYLYYKVGPSPREWWGEFVTSSNEGKTWSQSTKLTNQLGPVKNKPLITSLGTLLYPTSTETIEKWQVFIERSSDSAKTWNIIPIDSTNGAQVIQPTLLEYKNGIIQALCRSNQNYILESRSSDDGKNWSPLIKTNVLNPNSGIDAVGLKNGFKLLVYNPMKHGTSWVNGRNKLYVACSLDGIQWEDIYILEDQLEGEYSYPAIIETSDGKIHITYTYNRNNIKHVVLTN